MNKGTRDFINSVYKMSNRPSRYESHSAFRLLSAKLISCPSFTLERHL